MWPGQHVEDGRCRHGAPHPHKNPAPQALGQLFELLGRGRRRRVEPQAAAFQRERSVRHHGMVMVNPKIAIGGREEAFLAPLLSCEVEYACATFSHISESLAGDPYSLSSNSGRIAGHKFSKARQIPRCAKESS